MICRVLGLKATELTLQKERERGRKIEREREKEIEGSREWSEKEGASACWRRLNKKRLGNQA